MKVYNICSIKIGEVTKNLNYSKYFKSGIKVKKKWVFRCFRGVKSAKNEKNVKIYNIFYK